MNRLAVVVALALGCLGTVRPGMADGSRRAAPVEAPDSHGCRLVLNIPGASFKPGEPIPLDLEFVNASRGEITIWECGFWGNHLVEVVDEHGNRAPLTAMGERRRKFFSPDGGRDKNVRVSLRPGERYACGTAGADLGLMFRMKPGRYRARLIYDEQHEPGVLRCVSNWVDFRIR